MKAKQIIRICVFVLLFLGVTTYILYAVVEFRNGNQQSICEAVDVQVEGSDQNTFLDKSKVEAILKAQNVYPKGAYMGQIRTRDIENALKSNRFIRKVECFKSDDAQATDKGKVCIRVSLRSPVVYVMPAGTDGYYVDGEGIIIPNTVYTKNIVVATGNISEHYATHELSIFGQYMSEDSFWDEQIEQIVISVNRKKQRVITLIPRVGDQTIFLGTMDKFEKKLRRLKIFYQKGMPQVGWNKYKKLDLQYDNQIVCTK